MSVWVDYGSGPVLELDAVDLTTVNGSVALPETFKLGFAGGTGTVTNVHEIGNLVVTTLAPDLALELSSSTFDASGEATLSLNVRAEAAAGSTDGPIQLTTTLPAGLAPLAAAGSGWSCSISGQLVSCTRPGAGGSALSAGSSAPPVELRVQALAGPASLLVTAAVAVDDDEDASNDTASLTLTVPALAPPTGAEVPALPSPTDSAVPTLLPPTGSAVPTTGLVLAGLLLAAGAGALRLRARRTA